MELQSKPPSHSLFEVYLRLRPPPALSQDVPQTQQGLYPQLNAPERFLTVEPRLSDVIDTLPTHITLHPPSESRKRAVEKFAFTKVFEEETTQLDVFRETGIVSLVEGVIDEGRDGLLATLGVTGSGKSHTILGSKSQRGLTQLALDLLFRSLHGQILRATESTSLVPSLVVADVSEAYIIPTSGFLDGLYYEGGQERSNLRAPTPMMVGKKEFSLIEQKDNGGLWNQWSILGLNTGSSSVAKDRKDDCFTQSSKLVQQKDQTQEKNSAQTSRLQFWKSPKITRTKAKLRFGNLLQDSNFTPSVPNRCAPQRASALPQDPDVSHFAISSTTDTDYAILVSMYEVYNDRIFDLLSLPRSLKDLRRRSLLFKSTESSPDRKVVAGLRKIVCGSYEEALMVLEIGLTERRVAGTGSNSVSSRSHGFFCVEVKKRPKGGMSSAWTGAQLTLVDLAGSERARNAKTAGATLAEAGKINESLMYLGQCLQMQSDCSDGAKPSIVPFRQCKLTELLFSNSFPSSSHHSTTHGVPRCRNAQKAIMIVTADPVGDFNATSQILRYSALAREVTVPRIPSVTSTIFPGNTGISGNNKQHTKQSRSTTPEDRRAELEAAHLEISRLGDEVEILALRLAEEQSRRKEAEEAWQHADEAAEEVERAIREECWSDMERRIEESRRRWMEAWSEEADRGDEHLDRKLEILSRGIRIHEDAPETNNARINELENRNAALQRKVAALEREMQCRSPTKPSRTKPLVAHGIENQELEATTLQMKDTNVHESVNVTKTLGNRIENLTPRDWLQDL